MDSISWRSWLREPALAAAFISVVVVSAVFFVVAGQPLRMDVGQNVLTDASGQVEAK